jgi:hypothetical protein
MRDLNVTASKLINMYLAVQIPYLSYRIEIIHEGLNIYGFYHRLALYADILPLAIACGKLFGIKSQPVVRSI